MFFRTIDVIKDRNTIVSFRKESYVVSFGNEEGFGDEDTYVSRIQERAKRFPEGLVLVEVEGKTIGQIELQILIYEGENIGYVNLFYLISEYRGKGYGKELLEYAENFFRKNDITEYHLCVSPSNAAALRFYEKSGLTKWQEESNIYEIWRMKKNL
ncbi:GNAT family N-acetyltransferase [Paenibacillus sp. SYP-B3998]|uniref:GNAT family N-acetyltransferase n=1 Tax=Paenibacillus sp. SYP-B3998 TaxID=2678564 RepID=A0A6G3ZZT8_9BACL|nr:GNAT family N-acetyltransferase [Paenibacillus sp. SYP-B3998]NEW07652.1 GNAT family N-acetyltransferase [Paenibacillus sp. SYP-B3998]